MRRLGLLITCSLLKRVGVGVCPAVCVHRACNVLVVVVLKSDSLGGYFSESIGMLQLLA